MMDRAEAIKWLEGDRDRAKHQEKIFEESFSTPQENPYTPIVEIYDMAIAALREQEQSKWISVKERLPEDERSVLAYYGFGHNGTPDSDMMFTDVLSYFCFDPEPHWQHAGHGMVVTHWMPLPEPPEGGAER